MARDRAAYMREYRKRQQSARIVLTKVPPEAQDRIRALEDEVRHLKAELAKRATPIAPPSHVNAIAGPQTSTPRGVHAFNSRPFNPVPKSRK